MFSRKKIIIHLLLVLFFSSLYLSSRADDWALLWANVSLIEQKGLTQSALDEVNKIYTLAKKEKNQAQVAKTLFYIFKYNNILEEDDLDKILGRLETEVSESSGGFQSFLKSILAQTYWGYYKQNSYTIASRTHLTTPGGDYKTWDTKAFVSKVTDLFLESVSNKEDLKKTSLATYDDILLLAEDSKIYRPTLYDFLVFQALAFFENVEPYLAETGPSFMMNGPDYYKPASEFVNLDFNSENQSLVLKALRLYQGLLQFHLRDTKLEAFVDADLARLEFVSRHNISADNSKLYQTSLETLANRLVGTGVSDLVNYKMASYYFYRSDEEDNAIKAHKLCEKIILKNSKTKEAQNCRAIISKIEEKDLDFKVSEGNIEGAPFLVSVTYQNLSKIYARFVFFDDDLLKKSRDIFSKNTWEREEKLVQFYASLPALESWSVDLKNEGDYKQHTVEMPVKAPAKKGRYLLLLSSSPGFKTNEGVIAYNSTWVTNLGFLALIDQDDKDHTLLVFDRKTGAPVADADLTFYENKKGALVVIDSKKSDQNGVVEFPTGKSSRNFYLEIKKNGDRFFDERAFYQYPPYSRKENLRTVFFTDRSLYRPGQTLFFKAIIYSKDDEGKPKLVTGYNTQVTLKDPNNQTVKTLEVRTNEFGSFSGSFILPENNLNGSYRLETYQNSQYVSVEEYKRPRFEVLIDPLKGAYKLDDMVTVHGKAQSYSGAVIDGAEVSYTVTRLSQGINYHCEECDDEEPVYKKNHYQSYAPQTEIVVATGKVVTNEKGEFEIPFKALPDLSVVNPEGVIFTYKVSASVTDSAGETRFARQSLKVGTKSLAMTWLAQEFLYKEKLTPWVLDSATLNGDFIPAKGVITIYRLETPKKNCKQRLWSQPDQFLLSREDFEKQFPNDIYSDENEKQNWAKTKVEEISFDTTTDKELKLEQLNKLDSGVYTAELATLDPFGKEIKLERSFTLVTQDDKLPSQNLSFFAKTDDKISFEVGDSFDFWVGSSLPVTFFYFSEQNGKRSEIKWETVKSGKKKVSLPVLENHRGGFSVNAGFVVENRVFYKSWYANVPWSNKQLKLEFSTVRDKLAPGQKEEWKVKITGPGSEKISAEMVASLYDASLDSFKPHFWTNYFYPSFYTRVSLFQGAFGSLSGLIWLPDSWQTRLEFKEQKYDTLNTFGWHLFNLGRYSYDYYDDRDGIIMPSPSSANEEKSKGKKMDFGIVADQGEKKNSQDDTEPLAPTGEVTLRKNLQELAFFFPQLQTNEKGEVILSFTMPEALTRWKFMAFAHTADFKTGTLIKDDIVTQKDVMIQPFFPRFLREGDTITISATVFNLSDKEISGKSSLHLLESSAKKDILKNLLQSEAEPAFSIPAKQSQVVTWKLKIPSQLSVLTYQVTAKTADFSDGEESIIPVLPNRMLVTETLPFYVKGTQTKKLQLKKLLENSSPTLTHQNLTLEFTQNPVWYALMALPYLIEFEHECSEQTFARYYANVLGAYVVSKNPAIQKVFEGWKQKGNLKSPLEKNEELKSVILAETPWVLDAQSEDEQKARMAFLFDTQKNQKGLKETFNKLQKLQSANGAWPWFKGMEENSYITRHIVAGLGHLISLGVLDLEKDQGLKTILTKAVSYLDDQMVEEYDLWVFNNKKNPGLNFSFSEAADTLYARSFYNFPLNSKHQEAFDFYLKVVRDNWVGKNPYEQGLAALALARNKDEKTALDIIRSLKENSIKDEEKGMFWKTAQSPYWADSALETQALLIEAFWDVAKDKESVQNMQTWLLNQKRTKAWPTTKSTTEAIYALLLGGTSLETNPSAVSIFVGNQKVEESKDGATGYIKKTWKESEIRPEMGTVTVTKKEEGFSWGGLYWQYFEDLDKITSAETTLKIKKELFIEEKTSQGPELITLNKQTPKVGDKIIVRVEIVTDRDLEYVHLKDMRASTFEPQNVFSGFTRFGNLSYYQSTKDTATHFFFEKLPKGTYVLEYPLRVTSKGDFSNGISTLQSMYAPEFSAHSGGIRVVIP